MLPNNNLETTGQTLSKWMGPLSPTLADKNISHADRETYTYAIAATKSNKQVRTLIEGVSFE